MMTRRTVRGVTVGLAVTALVAGLFAWAVPAEAVERQDRGACSAGARYELEVERENTRLDISFSIDDATPRERWRIRIVDGGEQLARFSRTTDSDGELSTDRFDRRAGSYSSRVVVEATSASGQTCRGALRI
jgi:hypothetical protein